MNRTEFVPPISLKKKSKVQRNLQKANRFKRDYYEEQVDRYDNLGFLKKIFFQGPAVTKRGIKVATRRLDDITIYEWRLKLPDYIVESIKLENFKVRIGFDIKIADIDKIRTVCKA